MLTPSPKMSFVVEDDVTDVNADAEFDPKIQRHMRVLAGHAALYLQRTTRRTCTPLSKASRPWRPTRPLNSSSI
jgi:hypothetical protein